MESDWVYNILIWNQMELCMESNHQEITRMVYLCVRLGVGWNGGWIFLEFHIFLVKIVDNE